jgi:hypothetical protein
LPQRRGNATASVIIERDGVTHHRTASPTVLRIGAGIRAAGSTELLSGRALRLTGSPDAGLTRRAHCATSSAVLGVGRYVLAGSRSAAAELLPGRTLRLTGPTNASLTRRAHCAAGAAVLRVGRYILADSRSAAA